MITRFNIFESVSEPFKVGDYAIIPIRINNKPDLYIVKIVDQYSKMGEFYYTREGSEKRATSYYSHIKYWSESKDELEVKLSEIKYNL